MIEYPNVFVLGAGASYDAGLPLGTELLEQISRDTNFQIDDIGRKLEQGNGELFAVISRHHRSNEGFNSNLDAYFRAGRRISAAAEGANSIDDVLDTLEDKMATFVGKLAIARVILEKEKSTHFSTSKNRPLEFDLNKFDGTWYKQFGLMLKGRIRKSNASDIGKNTTIISFNYDRTVEHFLARFFERSFDIPLNESKDIVNKLNIIHPYGTVGKLDWQSNLSQNSPSIEFGGGDRPNLIAAASQIRTYTEQVKENTEQADEKETVVHKMQLSISGAAKLIFLGFGFHEQNMELLRAAEPNTGCKVYATAFDMSESNIEVFRSRIRRTLLAEDAISSQKDVAGHYKIVNNKCAELFKDFGMEIAS